MARKNSPKSESVAGRNFTRDIARAVAHSRNGEFGAGISLSSSNVSDNAQLWAQISTAQDSVTPVQSMPTADGGWVWPIANDGPAPIETGYWGSGGVDDWTLAASGPPWWETVSSAAAPSDAAAASSDAPSGAADDAMTAAADPSPVSHSSTIVALS
ncbi:hypothetical protein B0H14DRAFT_3496590 [Mycena olivaceomarginata]|nr:hypothetical protein B0H14DRAFT_3496590 [Mycena olivaceomarginata]